MLTRRRLADSVAVVKTTMDIDEMVLRQAEKQAQQAGKPLATVVEEALRASLGIAASVEPASPVATTEPGPGLEEDDPFFHALEEIREHGRLAALHRQVTLR